MKIKDIHIDGFGVWTDLGVDSLPDGMTLFYGPNEAGKTTLMQFIRACFYGFTPERRERYLPPVHGGTPGGAMRVTGPGGGYQIRRRVHATDSGTSDQSVAGHLTVTGQDGLSQGSHRLAMLLGQIDEPIFTNVFAIGLRELQELSTLDDTSAADELYKLSSGLDRVSLVDVMRTLRGARGRLVDASKDKDDAELGRLAALVDRREKLRDEVSELTSRGRRWAELATQRRTQDQEIQALRGRLADWEREARCVEVATSVRNSWVTRQDLSGQIKRHEADGDIPDEAPEQLVKLEAQLEERKEKIESIKKQRRELREKAAALPLSRRLVELQGRIEAASEQAPWVEALEEQIHRLEQQIEKTRHELDADAEKLGMDEEDRLSLADGGRTSLPDMSRQTMSALAAPARNVKEQLLQLKRAREESHREKKESETLGQRLHESLDHAQATNLHDAIKKQGATIALLRQRMQVDEHLEKTRRHFRDLEQESLDLATSEALPVERTILLGVPFLVGGIAVAYGLFHLFGFETFVTEADPTWGMICILMGFLSLALWYLGRERGDQGTTLDLEDCDRQIDTLRRQLREIESEREEIDSRLPSGTGSPEVRMREAEELHKHLEGLLPTYHGHQAALERYKAARNRAAAAAQGLKDARNQWRRTLQSLGLSDSMSPSSIRKLSEGWETVVADRRRLEALEHERDQRKRELASLAKRIEALYLEALGPETGPHAEKPAGGGVNSAKGVGSRQRDDEDDEEFDLPQRREPVRSPTLRKGPLEQLNHLQEELARQQHWIKRRRELIENDQQLKKQQASHARGVERLDGMRRSLWAKCGVATAEQFYAMVDTKSRLAELRRQAEDADRQIRSIIGTQCDYDDVARELDNAKPEDLKRRWDSLTERISQTEERIGGLQTRQGELAQEMRFLAEDRRLSHAQLELECLERQIEAIQRRWQILAMSSSLLEDVCATFEKERQPETLREASSFLGSLTDGKYTRIWTPLGTNQLKIDDSEGRPLPIEVLSRGTREAVFIALRLALAAAYARRGVMLPLVLDDVLVNFDRTRAVHAARTLKHFAELGHQVLMFTCHDHIAQIFHDIDVQVRLLPSQGCPGVASIMPPPAAPIAAPEPVAEESDDEELELEDEIEVAEAEVPLIEEPEVEEPVAELLLAEEPETQLDEPPVAVLPAVEEPRPEPVLEEPEEELQAEIEEEPEALEESDEEDEEEPEPVMEEPEAEEIPAPAAEAETDPEPELDWVWYQRDVASQWLDDSEDSAPAPADVWQRPPTWWNENLLTEK